MIFGVFSGVLARAMPHHHQHEHDHSSHSHHHHDCPGGDHEDDHNEDPDDGTSPCDQPHTHVCCFTAVLLMDEIPSIRLPANHGQFHGILVVGVLIPENPVFELDLPPLI